MENWTEEDFRKEHLKAIGFREIGYHFKHGGCYYDFHGTDPVDIFDRWRRYIMQKADAEYVYKRHKINGMCQEGCDVIHYEMMPDEGDRILAEKQDKSHCAEDYYCTRVDDQYLRKGVLPPTIRTKKRWARAKVRAKTRSKGRGSRRNRSFGSGNGRVDRNLPSPQTLLDNDKYKKWQNDKLEEAIAKQELFAKLDTIKKQQAQLQVEYKEKVKAGYQEHGTLYQQDQEQQWYNDKLVILMDQQKKAKSEYIEKYKVRLQSNNHRQQHVINEQFYSHTTPVTPTESQTTPSYLDLHGLDNVSCDQ